MSNYRGVPFSPVEAQVDMMKAHVTRGAARDPKSAGERTLQMAVPDGWTKLAKCIGDFRFDESTGLDTGQAAKRCEGCPVIEQCLAAALTEEHGLSAGNRYTVRGGMTPKERAELQFAGMVCERGHSNRWGTVKGTDEPRCLECLAEDRRERYAGNREHYVAQAAMMREANSIRQVSCLECQKPMRVSHFDRHIEVRHNAANSPSRPCARTKETHERAT